MRRLNEMEINLINSDLEPFELFFRNNGLMNNKFLSKYTGIIVRAEDEAVLKGASGQALRDGDKRYIKLNESIFSNSKKRPNVLYHELGHYLVGLKNSDEKVINSVLKSIARAKRKNKKELIEDPAVYVEGLVAIEEYLVEKFAILMLQRAKGFQEPSRKTCKNPQICGNYIYNTTFESNWGILESLGEEFVNKTYGNLTNAIEAGFKEEFFTGFFEKYDNVELMKILGNLGHIYRALRAFGGHDKNQSSYEPEQIHQILDSTNQMIDRIQIKTRKNTICPTEISNASTNVLQNNPGILSSGVEKIKGIFSRIFNRNKTQEK